MNVDTTCRMHYQVRLHGIDRREEFQLVLEDHPMKNLKALHLAPGRQLDLQVCFFHVLTNLVFDLPIMGIFDALEGFSTRITFVITLSFMKCLDVKLQRVCCSEGISLSLMN